MGARNTAPEASVSPGCWMDSSVHGGVVLVALEQVASRFVLATISR